MMGEAKNHYPRLCWACLTIIPSYEYDSSLLDYGGWCASCYQRQLPELLGLRAILQGHSERMNNELERDELIQELRRYYEQRAEDKGKSA